MKRNHFARAFLLVLIAGLLGVAGLNILVDPFYRFNVVTIPGINQQRYMFSTEVRLAKAGIVCRLNPSAVILGSSRNEVGFNPRHPAFGGEPTYNLAMAGSGLQEIYDTLRHAKHAAPALKRVVIGLDFFTFNAYREEVVFKTEVVNFDPKRLLLSANDSCFDNFLFDADRTIGFRGLQYVWQTIRAQKSESERLSVANIEAANWWTAVYDADGYRGDSYKVLEALASGGGAAADETLPVNWQGFQQRGDGRVGRGDFLGAIEDYTVALKGSPPNPALFFSRGSAYLQTGSWEEAAQDFRAGLTLDPNNEPLKILLESAQAENVVSNRRIFFAGDNAAQEKYYLRKIWRAGPQHRYCFSKAGQKNTLDVFRELVRFSKSEGLDVRFVINPVHARMLVAIQEGGLWPQYEEWKSSLVRILSEEADHGDSKQMAFPLWDFAGFNSITTEVPPELKNPHQIARWFWEPSHMRAETGDMVLSRVFDRPSENTSLHPDFGYLLAPSNIDGWLASVRAQGRDYIAHHEKEVSSLRERIKPVFADWTGANCGEGMDAALEGAAALNVGNAELAEKKFRLARSIDEQGRQLAARLGVPYRERDIEQTIADVKAGKVLEQPLENWQAFQERGVRRAGAGQLQGAIADFSAALKDSPPNAALYFLRGKTRLELGLHAEAAEDFEAGLKIEPHNQDLKFLLAVAQSGSNRKTTVDSWQSLQEQGARNAEQGKLQEAIENFSAALEKSPPNAALYFQRGSARLGLEDWDGAIVDFEAGLKLAPDSNPLRELLKKAKEGLQAKSSTGSVKETPASSNLVSKGLK